MNREVNWLPKVGTSDPQQPPTSSRPRRHAKTWSRGPRARPIRRERSFSNGSNQRLQPARARRCGRQRHPLPLSSGRAMGGGDRVAPDPRCDAAPPHGPGPARHAVRAPLHGAPGLPRCSNREHRRCARGRRLRMATRDTRRRDEPRRPRAGRAPRALRRTGPTRGATCAAADGSQMPLGPLLRDLGPAPLLLSGRSPDHGVPGAGARHTRAHRGAHQQECPQPTPTGAAPFTLVRYISRRTPE